MTGGCVLVTGGAGFIGTHLARALVHRGTRVRILDSLEPQVHFRAPVLPEGCEFVEGDVGDRNVVARALGGVTAVVHFAALVGVGQSMYEMACYVRTNTCGTAVLLEEVVRRRDTIRRLLVASSMSIYGEGAYLCPACGEAREGIRRESDMAVGRWEPMCGICGADLRSIPTPEGKPLRPSSVYAVTKRDQEELVLSVGRAYGMPAAALRFFNVYGPGQSLSNPYTGVVAIFAARLLSGLPPLVFEDGRQTRDFIHVSDVVAACMTALDHPEVDGIALNVGSGRATRIADLAASIQRVIGGPDPVPTQRYRPGDVRHCVADISEITRLVGWNPKVRLEDGLTGMVEWLREQHPPRELLDRPFVELERAGLLR